MQLAVIRQWRKLTALAIRVGLGGASHSAHELWGCTRSTKYTFCGGERGAWDAVIVNAPSIQAFEEALPKPTPI